jgi:hypothetical protein
MMKKKKFEKEFERVGPPKARDMKKLARSLYGSQSSSAMIEFRPRLVSCKLYGPTMTIPRVRGSKAVFFSSALVNAAQFNTKTNTNGSGQIVGNAGGQGNAFAFSIGDIPEIASYVALYDQYILYKILVRIVSNSSPGTSNATGANLYIVPDFDNATLLTSVPQAESYSEVQELRGNFGTGGDTAYMEIVPGISLTTNAGNVIEGPMWQDCAVTTNRHYGVKTFYNTSLATDARWNVDAKYYFGFRNLQ